MDPLKTLSPEFKPTFVKVESDPKTKPTTTTPSTENKPTVEKTDLVSKDDIAIKSKTATQPTASNFSFVEDPKPKVNINDPKFKMPDTSYSSLGVGDKNVVLNVTGQRVLYSKPIGSLDSIAQKYNNPEKVAQLVGSMGSTNYDTPRSQGIAINGPAGSKKPEDTLNDFKGVCRDVHQLAAYMLSKNGYDAVSVGYTSAQTSHSITSYKEPNGKGYGILEYDKVYTPEDVKKLLGRYASSPEEAVNALNYGTAAAIYKWTPPKEGQVGNIEGIFYTSKFKNYHKTLELDHKDGMMIDKDLGVQLEKTLGSNFSIKAGFNPLGSDSDPTAKNSFNVAVGYKVGNENNFLKASAGMQYRPEDGSRVVGSTEFVKNPTLLAGVRVEGQYRPFTVDLGKNNFTTTTISGRAGSGFAFNGQDKSDNGKRTTDGTYGFDQSYTSGLSDLKVGVEQKFYGDIGKGFSYSAAAFANYDGNLAVAGIAMGGNPASFVNVGTNARLNYSNGPVNISAYGQYMAHQVNNLDNTTLGLSASYVQDKFSIYSSSAYSKSIEGGRVDLEAGGSYSPNKNLTFRGGVKQEVVLPNGTSYAGDTNAFLKAEVRF